MSANEKRKHLRCNICDEMQERLLTCWRQAGACISLQERCGYFYLKLSAATAARLIGSIVMQAISMYGA